MLLNLEQILAPAKQKGFAVGGFNVTESTMFKAVVEEAEKLQAPVIIQVSPNEFAFAGEDLYVYFIKRLEKSKNPFVLHLDHSKSYGGCVRAVQAGFTSVMFDGSHLSYEENVEKTRKIVEMAHAVGVSVEGEIGIIGETKDFENGIVKDMVYTTVDDAKRFYEDTGVDALAVSIGTVHGLLPKEYIPELHIQRLKEIANEVPIPLVLHGGSGTPEEEIIVACKNGINKVNISSEFKKAYYQSVRAFVENNPTLVSPTLVAKDAVEQVKDVVASKIKCFGSAGTSRLY